MAFVAFSYVAQAQNNRVAGPNKPQAAAVDYLLELDGIKGESKSPDCRGCIDIESFSWGTTNPSTTGAHGAGGGGGAGKVSVHDISITKMTDKSSSDLMQASATGQHIKSAKLFVRKQGSDQHEYLTYELENVLVSSFSTSGHGSSSDRPMESLSLNFTKITFQWTDEKGKVKNLGAGQTPQSALQKFLKK